MMGKRVAAAPVVAWLGALLAYLASVTLTRLPVLPKSFSSLCAASAWRRLWKGMDAWDDQLMARKR